MRRRVFLIGSSVAAAAGAAALYLKRQPSTGETAPTAPAKPSLPPGMAVAADQPVLPERYRDVLRAMVARVYPEGEGSPGAVTAKAYDYIERELRYSNMQGVRRLMMNGAVQLDRLAIGQMKRGFVQLAPADQDLIITAVQGGEGAPKSFDGEEFVAAAVALTIEGVFSDPIYGGNADEVGWRSIGYTMQNPRPTKL